MTVTTVLAADEISAGGLGLLIVVLLGVATVFLIRNMTNRIKRLPPTFTPEAITREEDDPDESASGPTSGA